MIYSPNQIYYKEFTTQNSSGAATNADSLPVATARTNSNPSSDAEFILTVDNIDTGHYSITGIVPNDYSAGEVVSILVEATVGGVSAKAIVDTFTVSPSVKLTSDALDNISITEPVGVASDFREMMVQVWRRFFKKVTKTTADGIQTYADDDTTPLTTQTVDETVGDEEVGSAS